jgi:NDP-sugar pyrophosphorylase family protein
MDLTLVIPAAGRGSRFPRDNPRTPKGMILVAGKPILEFVVMAGLQSPANRIVFVISKDGDAIPEYFGCTYEGVPVSYVIQTESLGLAHAVSLVERHVSEFMLIINGDEIYLKTLNSLMCDYLAEVSADGLVGYLRTSESHHIRRGYGMTLDPSGRVLKLIEKPRETWNDVLGVGTWIVRAEFFDFFRRTPFNELREERDFVEVVQLMVNEGRAMYGFDMKGDFVNINTPADLVRAEAALAENFKLLHGRPAAFCV